MKRKNPTVKKSEEEFKILPDEKYILTLYVTGSTPQSLRAVANIKKLCDEYLHDRYDLEVVDLYQQPQLAKTDQIIVAPTLVKKLPLPLRRIIGDLSANERVIIGLDLKKEDTN